MSIKTIEQLEKDLEKANQEYQAADTWQSMHLERTGQNGDMTELNNATKARTTARKALEEAMRGNS